MAKTRRQFLAETSLAVLGAAAAVRAQGQTAAGQNPADLPPGAPPAFGARRRWVRKCRPPLSPKRKSWCRWR